MSAFTQVLIGGYPSGGLMTDRKPLMLPSEAFSDLKNAYVFRERTKKREGLVGVGLLQRNFLAASIGNSPASLTWTITSIYVLVSPAITETNAQINIGSMVITGGPDTFTDQGNGILRRQDGNLLSTINYVTGAIVLQRTTALANAFTATFGYFPSLPVMGICKLDISTLGIDDTIYFDTKYAYHFVSGSFSELVPGTTWTAPKRTNGTNTYFFWAANYQGSTPNLRFFFVTNNYIDPAGGLFDPIRYYNPLASSWTALTPIVADVPQSPAQIKLFQGLIIIPYYGRLLILNTWEGPNLAGATNFFSRCRFSQIGDPTNTDPLAWRSDIFGRGGFIDAPTNEAIVSAAFFRNTLIVFFEYSTWQLRYIGEYGLPFIFERISSDFGAVSTYSPIVFDQGVMAVSDRGIIQASANGLSRLDEQIPETVFSFEIQENAPNFVHGIRDFEKELVYWNYLDVSEEESVQVWPNTTLLFNYKNNTWAQFRDTITCFGVGQFQFAVTWDSLTTYWESNASWDNVDDQVLVDYVTAGNQQGYIFIYENPDASSPIPSDNNFTPTLSITAVDFTQHPTQFTIPHHNLNDGEIIYITGALWSGTDPGINNQIYQVTVFNPNPASPNYDTITLSQWNGNNYAAIDITSSAIYIGGGQITLFPKMNIVGKDFNPFQGSGKQFKLSYIDFQMDSNEASPAIPAVTIQLFVNSYMQQQANFITGNQEISNSAENSGFITNIQLSNPCIVTSPDHSLLTGTVIYVANVLTTTQINAALYTITVIDANNFSLNNTDATGWTPYQTIPPTPPTGIWNTDPKDGQSFIPGTEYAWYRFYSTQFGQYLRVALTYDDVLMNQLSTHQTPMELNAMNLWMKEGGRLIN
jgi:hypothetical protein